jgi:predicted alpha/beta hydrolase family esterase
MKQALILHGTDASPEANWFRWLEGVMKNMGCAVWLPQLPNSAAPSTKTYNSFLLSNSTFEFEGATLIGHSSGAVEILSLLQHLPESTTVGDVYLVSAFKDNLNWDALDELFLEPYDYELIKAKARSITVIHSDNDPYVPTDHARFLAEKLNARLLLVGGQGHFNLEQSEEYRQFPLLAQIIETRDILKSSDKLNTFRGQSVEFVETQHVKDGVKCDVYSFTEDNSKDLGILHIKQGSKTPKQRILKGDKTVEGFLEGAADLTISRNSPRETIYTYADNSYGADMALGIGDTMQWIASEDSACYEICYPPYEDGRFEELGSNRAV